MRLKKSDLISWGIVVLAVVGALLYQLNLGRVEKMVLEMAHQAVRDHIGRPNEVIDTTPPDPRPSRAAYTYNRKIEELPLPGWMVALPLDKIEGYRVNGDVGPDHNYYTVYLEKQGRNYVVKSVQVDGWKPE